jgi:PadR family transcriptional regulator, regulatory protein PadR
MTETIEQKKPEDFLPLSTTAFYVLGTLSEGGEKHGYRIARDVEELSEGVVKFGVGSLYPLLGRLLDQGLIERAGGTSNERQKSYKLTGLGERVFRAELARMRRMIAVGGLAIGRI